MPTHYVGQQFVKKKILMKKHKSVPFNMISPNKKVTVMNHEGPKADKNYDKKPLAQK